MNKFFAAGLLATTALAAGTSPALKSRQLVEIPCEESGMQTCGDGCIDQGWTCCPGGEGGCGPSEYCHSEGGCCPKGEICVGDGGASTFPGYTATSTVDVEIPTYTVPPPESSTPPTSSTPTPSSSASPTYPTQAPPTFTGAADRIVGSGAASFAGVIAGLFML